MYCPCSTAGCEEAVSRDDDGAGARSRHVRVPEVQGGGMQYGHWYAQYLRQADGLGALRCLI